MRRASDEQRARRDLLERELEALRTRKPSLEDAEYLRALESILRRLAALYAEEAVES